VTDSEREWQFTPKQAWARGEYEIVAQNILEDISGNHLDRAFDVDLITSPGREAARSATSTLLFVTRP
jgi:hypothetical protein